MRELFGNPAAPGDPWIEQHALLMAVVWPIVITAIFLPLAVRRLQRLSGRALRVERLTGRPARTFRAWAQENAATFR